MNGVLPDEIVLEAVKDDGDMVRFSYIEKFTAETYDDTPRADLLASTEKLLSELLAQLGLPVSLTVGDDFLALAGIVPRAAFGNMMAGEFFLWSSVAEMRLRDLLIARTVGR